MIAPVQPVGLSVVGSSRALLDVRFHLLCTLARCRPHIASPAWLWICNNLGPFNDKAAFAPAIWEALPPSLSGSPCLERWEAWSAHEPFADEITRWWPSDDWPPESPAVVIEDRSPDAPVQVIDWYHTGGLLDTWV